MLEARQTVRGLKEYHPPLGGRVGMRLDFNENTGGCSPRVLAALRALDSEPLNRYPEREPAERQIAEFLGLAAEQVLLTNGVDEGIHLLCETYLEAGDEVLIPVPTFSMYEIYAAAAGASIVTVQADESFRFPAEALLEKITPRTRMIAIANPNNPTGTVASEGDLLQLAAAAPDAAVLVDEAYFDFYGHTLLPQIREYPNIFVARTFSKAYGMAGLRAGVLAGDMEQMRMVRRVSSPYNVNAVALACVTEAIRDQQYIADYVAQVRRGRARVEAELRALGVPYWPSEANFVLFRIGELRPRFVEAMRARGILVRDRHRDPGCAGCVRITVGADAQNEFAVQTLKEVLQQVGWGGGASSIRPGQARDLPPHERVKA